MSAAINLLKRGLHEVPHLVLGAGVYIFGGACCAYATYINVKYDRLKKAGWKRRYVVVREEDFDPSMQIHDIDRRYPWW